MTRTHIPVARIFAVTAGLLPGLARAHPGHDETPSFIYGALHPLSGIDHVLGFLAVGLLVGYLGSRYLWPLTAALLGLWVAASTANSDGWQYAAGFMTSGSSLVAAGVATARLYSLALTAAATRSPTWAANAAPAHRPWWWR